MILRLLAFVLVLLAAVPAVPSSSGAQPAADVTAAPAEARELLRLLDDPGVRAWIERERSAEALAAPAPSPPSASDELARRLAAVSAHLRSVREAVPRLPSEVARLGRPHGGAERAWPCRDCRAPHL